MSESIILGGSNTNGTVSVCGKDGQPLVELLGRDNESVIGAGQKGRPGRLTMYNANGQQTVNLSTTDAHLTLGGSGTNGTVSVLGKDGQPLVELLGRDQECVIGLGQKGRPARISLYGGAGQEAVQLNGGTGDILLFNADCAEEFDLAPDAALVEPGSVVVLDEDRCIREAVEAYDRRAAGIVSGAGQYKPALVLDRRAPSPRRLPVALMGKVFCKVDAAYGSVRSGDLLTTSTTPGHAMKVADPQRACGNVIGKAMARLDKGVGLVPVLVMLR